MCHYIVSQQGRSKGSEKPTSRLWRPVRMCVPNMCCVQLVCVLLVGGQHMAWSGRGVQGGGLKRARQGSSRPSVTPVLTQPCSQTCGQCTCLTTSNEALFS